MNAFLAWSVASLVASGLAGPAAGLATDVPEPTPIYQGAEVETCGWPTAVAVSGGGSLCTGTLVHPRVVVYAAHCGGGEKKVRFIERLSGFGQNVNAECETNPSYNGSQGTDYAYCVLEVEAELPVTPAVYGCETSVLTPGRSIALVGFGNNSGESGAGTKRWGMTVIGSIGSSTAKVPGGGNPSVCSGDSGGPAFVQYSDGSWHAFGIASTVSGGCGGSGTYGLIHNAVPWIESSTGIDITPCHDTDGTWNPTPYCQAFFAGGSTGSGLWSDWCEGTPVSPSSASCGDAFDAVPDIEAPEVQITSPGHLERFEVDEFSGDIAIEAHDGQGWGVVSVRLVVNGEEQPIVDDEAPWGFHNVSFPRGTWELMAVAEDWGHNLGMSPTIVIGIGEDPEVPEEETTSSEGGDSGQGDTGGGTDGFGPFADETGAEGCGCRVDRPAYPGLAILLLLAVSRRRSDVSCS